MSIDGFERREADGFSAFDPSVARRFYKSLGWVARTLRIDVDGVDRLPQGRALLVANHTFGWDSMFPMEAVWRQTGRSVWALGEHAWWRVPFLRRLAAAAGTIDGTNENADRLLSRGELVLVLPGGLREAVKPRELRYRLLWGHRYGFIRAAIRNQSPIVPVASIGADDMFDLVGNAFRRGERVFGPRGFPIPLPSRILPIPHLVRLRFVFGEPIPMRVPVEAEQDDAAVRSLRREVEGALHELIETELARRAGIPL